MTYRGTFHQWLITSVRAIRTLPTSCAQSCMVSHVGDHSATGNAGHTLTDEGCRRRKSGPAPGPSLSRREPRHRLGVVRTEIEQDCGEPTRRAPPWKSIPDAQIEARPSGRRQRAGRRQAAAWRSGRSRLLASFIGRFTTAELIPTAMSPVAAALRPVGPARANSAAAAPTHSFEWFASPERRRRSSSSVGVGVPGDRSIDGKVDLGELVKCLGGDGSPGRRAGLHHLCEPFCRRRPRASVGGIAHCWIVPRAVAQNRRRVPPAEPAAGE